MKLTTAQQDRAYGVLLATAAGDALGAGYEFKPPMPDDEPVAMIGGGTPHRAPGEWTDDTSMAVAVAEVAAQGVDLRTESAQDGIVARWEQWARHAKDVGIQTRQVLSEVGGRGSTAARAAAAALHERTGRTAGNGSLMRTAPVALAYLDDPEALVEAAVALSSLTHHDPEAGEACALWCLAIRHAVLTGLIDARVVLSHLPAERQAVWSQRLDVAERSRPADFARNGWVVEALQGAWSAIATTAVPADDPDAGTTRAHHLRLCIESAVRGGNDTDTVAAIAGGLVGGAYGASAVPASWRRLLHGWPGMRARDLVQLGARIVRGGAPDPFDYSYRSYPLGAPVVKHPYDDGLLLGDVGALRQLPAEVDAVVSLCMVGEPVPAVREWVEIRLIDRVGADENPNLDFVLDDTVSTIEELRDAGRTVLLHCVQAHSRTPTVAALYGMRKRGVSPEQALADIRRVLPHAYPNADFRAALARAARRKSVPSDTP